MAALDQPNIANPLSVAATCGWCRRLVEVDRAAEIALCPACGARFAVHPPPPVTRTAPRRRSALDSLVVAVCGGAAELVVRLTMDSWPALVIVPLVVVFVAVLAIVLLRRK